MTPCGFVWIAPSARCLLQLRRSGLPFQIPVFPGERYLEGGMRTADPVPHSCSVYAVDEGFDHDGVSWFRHNEIWRDVVDRRTGNRVDKEFIKRNPALFKVHTRFNCR